MAPRRRPARERQAPVGFVRAEDVQRIVQEALAAAGVQPIARQDQVPVQTQDPVAEIPLQGQVRDQDYEQYSKCWRDFRKCDPRPMEVSQSQRPQMVG